MSDPSSGGAGPIIIRRSVDTWREHGTKLIGYASAIAGVVAVMDPALVADTLGPNAVRWALLVTGVATALRGHTNKVQPLSDPRQPKS